MRKILGLIIVINTLLVFFFSPHLFAQEQKIHEKSFYQAPDGKLYMQRSLPIYLKVSTSPDASGEVYDLPAQASHKEHANPMYFDTEGRNTFRTPWIVDKKTKRYKLPLEELVFDIYTDSRPPWVGFKADNCKTYRKDGKLYCGKDMKIKLNSRDSLAGVKQVYISTDLQSFKDYKDAIACSDEKEYNISFYAVDNVGNSSKTAKKSFITDFTSPSTEIKLEKDFHQAVVSYRTKITFPAKDSNVGVAATYYSIDGKKFRKFYNFIKIGNLSEGEHTIRYYSEDFVGNKETEKSFSFFVDKSAPIVVDEVLGSQFVSNGKGYSSGRTKFKLTAVDNKAGVKEIFYSLNGGAYVKYEKPFYLPSRSGNLTIRYYAVDNVNNRGGSSQEAKRSNITYVDLTGPSLSHKYGKPIFNMRDTVFINSKTKINLKGFDQEAGIQRIAYSIDKNKEIDYKTPFSISTDGIHHIDYVGYDNVDNSNRKTFFCIVDNTPPDVYSRFSILPIRKKIIDGKEIDVYPHHVVLFFPATDAVVGYSKTFYSINGGREKVYTRFIDGFKSGNKYKIKARVLDKLGNEATKEVEFYVE